MMWQEAPPDFDKRGARDIVGCYVQHGGTFLLLRRHAHKSSGDKWGLPAGKMDEGEERLEAMQRELHEETGIDVPQGELAYFDSRFVRNGEFDFAWHMFSTSMGKRPAVRLSPSEHKDFAWVTPEESLGFDLIHDLDESIRLFYRI